MKIIIWSAGISFVILSILGGCTRTKIEEEKVKIVYSWASYVQYDEIRIEQARGFEKLFPYIEVVARPTTWTEYLPKILTLTAGGTPPDVFAIYNVETWIEW